MPLQTIKTFQGIHRPKETTDLKTLSLDYAEGMVAHASGGFRRAPGYERLWQVTSLGHLKSALGIVPSDNTCCIKLVNEGETFLAFYDFANDLGLGIFYAGKDAEFSGSLENGATLTARNPTLQVLWRHLSPRLRLSGALISGRLYMGNGADPNLVYDATSNTMGIMGANATPLTPTLTLSDIVAQQKIQSSFEFGGLRFEADARLGGNEGNHLTIAIQGGTGDAFVSRLDGKGTFCDPLQYEVTCPSPMPTNEALASFIKRDPKASGILRCEVVAASSQQAPLFPQIFLVGGADATPPRHSGVEEKTFEAATSGYIRLGIKVLLTYIREDARLGLVESAPSPTAMIETAREGATAHAVQVDIQQDTASPESARWTGIRLYAAETCLDCTCERRTQWLRLFELPNETQRAVIYPWHVNARARTDANREGHLIQESALRAAQPPEPAKKFVFANHRIYMTGNCAHPLRIYFTKEQTSENALSETTGQMLYRDFVPQGSGSHEATHLAEFHGSVIAFAGRSAYDPETNATQTITTAPLNEFVGIPWNNGNYYYLGQDFNVYRISAAPSDATSKPLDTPIAQPIGSYIREHTDVTDTIAPHGFLDFTNHLWWVWTRAKFGGMVAFALDLETHALTGPFYLPQLISATMISPADGRLIGLTLRGEVMVWNLRALAGSLQPFRATSGIALADSNTTTPSAPDYQGFGIVYFKNGTSLLKGNLLRLQTGWMDFGSPETLKGFYEFHWTVVKHSAGIVCLRFETDDGIFKDWHYGDVYGKEHHKILTLLYGAALRVTFLAWVEHDKDFAVRDWSIGWKKLGNQ